MSEEYQEWNAALWYQPGHRVKIGDKKFEAQEVILAEKDYPEPNMNRYPPVHDRFWKPIS